MKFTRTCGGLGGGEKHTSGLLDHHQGAHNCTKKFRYMLLCVPCGPKLVGVGVLQYYCDFNKIECILRFEF